MVEIADVDDRDSLRDWLQETGQSREACVWLASRAALWVLPIAWAEASSRLDLTPLPILRANLIAGVAPVCPTPAIKSAAAAAYAAADAAITAAAYAAADRAASDAAYAAITAAAYAAADRAASDAAYAAITAAAYAAFSAAVTAAAATDATADLAVWEASRRDMGILQDGDFLGKGLRLWPAGGNPLEDAWREVKRGLAQGDPASARGVGTGLDWSFWLDWYQDALDGKTPDWDVLEEIALSGLARDGDYQREDFNPFWEGTDAEVLARINEIVERHALLAEIRKLKAERDSLRAAASASAAHRSHNNPPELVEEQAQQEVTIVWAYLDDIEVELKKPDIDHGRLRRLGQRLVSQAREVLSLAGKDTKKDMAMAIRLAVYGGGGLALMARIVEFGEWLGRFVGPSLGF
ncbi:hypothetical protein [Roseisalinus antarcticus]|uniref:Uncharacterized protein n=1 Tax=Roseisalinus antarcticus TaxID=254357 RepID=A0A1Y5SFW3_9RHOB|nr:hypothetical protein [Roseisalinus antarcticus]SLN39862.1 hypothetical protein ROA7023_01535 [Roseisalinus antarcticus]